MPEGILLLYFLLLRMQSFSHHGATCVLVPQFANLGIDGIILRSSPVSGNSDLELYLRLVRLCQYLLLNYSQTFII